MPTPSPLSNLHLETCSKNNNYCLMPHIPKPQIYYSKNYIASKFPPMFDPSLYLKITKNFLKMKN